MPVFLLPWIASAVVALTVSFLFLRSLKGKRFAVLGPAGAGKSTFIGFLRTGEVTLAYEQTAAPIRLNGKKIRLKEHELKIEEFVDLPGTKDFHATWKKQALSSDVICYLFDAHQFARDEDYVHAIFAEIRHVTEWRKDGNKDLSSVPLFVIGTHMDQMSDYQAAGPEEQGRLVSALWTSGAFLELSRRAGGGTTKCLAGSLATQEGSEQLVGRVISAVASAE